MNEEFNNSFSLTTLKAYLFDLISKETTKQQTLKETISKEQDTDKRKAMEEAFNEKGLILNNIINKANELTLEIEKLNKENNGTILSDKPYLKISSNDFKEEKDNNEKTLEEASIDNISNEEASYPEITLSKETNDPAKAIIVSIKQFKKLQDSKMTQQELILKNKTSEAVQKEIEPVINIALDEEETKEKEDTSNKESEKVETEVIPTISEDQKNENEKDTKTASEKEENIEELINKANALYKEGNLQESEALFEKISSLNKQNKTQIKIA